MRNSAETLSNGWHATPHEGWFLAWAVLCAGLWHCNGASMGADDTGSADAAMAVDAPAPPAFTLTVSGAQYATALQEITVSPGNQFLVVNLSLTNVSVPAALGGSPQFFSATLASHLVLSVSAESYRVPMPCQLGVSAAAGGTLNCSVVFEVAIGDTPASLGYNDQLGHMAVAAIPTPQAAPPDTLLGTWAGEDRGGGDAFVFTFNADGSVDTAVSPGGCPQALNFTGQTWQRLGIAEIQFSSTDMCSGGSIVCVGNPVTCRDVEPPPRGTCTTVLSNGDSSLQLTCSTGMLLDLRRM